MLTSLTRLATFAARGRGDTARSWRHKATLWFALSMCGSAVVLGAAGVALHVAVDRLGPPKLDKVREVSTIVLDRQDQLLRAFTTQEGRWRLPISPEKVDERYLAMLMAFEDKRFYSHPGIDARALMRAAW